MSWFRRKDKNITDNSKKNIPSGLWLKCPTCSEIQYKPELDKNYSVCRHCEHHFRVQPSVYRDLLLDEGTFTEIFNNIKPSDPLDFEAEKKYERELTTSQLEIQEQTFKNIAWELHDNVGQLLSVISLQLNMILVKAPETIVSRSIESAREKKIPLILIPSSGGARMQEGIFSLMQMPRTVIAVNRLKKAKLPYIVLLTDPTTGGVTASFGMLGDVILAEPGALIGFAGPRVVRDTIRQTLPEGFQRAEFLKDKGFVDRIVPRQKMKDILSKLIEMLIK